MYEKTINDRFGIMFGNDVLVFIKTGRGGSIYGKDDKYLNLSSKIRDKYGYTVVVSSNPPEENANIETEFKEVADNIDYPDEIIFIGISNGALVGAQQCWKDERVRKMLLINGPLMINWPRTKKGLNLFSGDKAELIYGSLDSSFQYIECLDLIDNKRVSYKILKEVDHGFTNNSELLEHSVMSFLGGIMKKEKSSKQAGSRVHSRFDEIIGYDDIKAELIRFCDVLKNPEKYHKLGVTMPCGILLDGEPGIGKTLMARCFIEESGCKSYTIRKAKPNGDFVKEIQETFEKAKKDDTCIVFLDDMDKYANEDNIHVDAEEYVAVQSCIDECKGHGVFVIATINDRNCLPQSLLRVGRFDKVISVDVPEGEESIRIIEHYLKQKETLDDISAEEIARIMEGHTCAELESVVNEAGIYAAYSGRKKVSKEDLLRACMGILFDSLESNKTVKESYIRNVAIHEAGHAVIAEVLDPGSVSLVSVSRYTGSTEGVTVIKRPEEHLMSFKERENELIRQLGGKAATEIVLGSADMGCSSDVNIAFGTAYELVQGLCAYGYSSFYKFEPSDYVLENRDRAAAQLIEESYARAKEILFANRELFDRMVEELVAKKTITYTDIKKLRERIDIAA